MYPAIGRVSYPGQQKCQGLPRSGGDSTATRGVHGWTERHRTFGVYGQFGFISSWYRLNVKNLGHVLPSFYLYYLLWGILVPKLMVINIR